MRGRGNVTWGFADKKPYKIKFDKKQDILGMGKNKHWALLANRFDGSMLRNRLAMYIASRLGMEYTPKMLPVDLVIDGKYMGSYYLSELVRIGKNRVDIDELTPDDNEEPNITGGYLLAIEPNLSVKPAPEQNTVTTERGEAFSFESPEFYSEDDDDILGTAQQKDYIKEYLNETEEAIFGENFKNSNGISYTEYLDVVFVLLLGAVTEQVIIAVIADHRERLFKIRLAALLVNSFTLTVEQEIFKRYLLFRF